MPSSHAEVAGRAGLGAGHLLFPVAAEDPRLDVAIDAPPDPPQVPQRRRRMVASAPAHGRESSRG